MCGIISKCYCNPYQIEPKQFAAYPETVKPCTVAAYPAQYVKPCGPVKRDPAQYARTCQAVCNPAVCNPACYTPERSTAAGAACHGFCCARVCRHPLFRFFADRAEEVKNENSRSDMPRLAFCAFCGSGKLNCAKYVFVEINKTKKTAYLLAFCKYAEFLTNFASTFLPESCDLYGL